MFPSAAFLSLAVMFRPEQVEQNIYDGQHDCTDRPEQEHLNREADAQCHRINYGNAWINRKVFMDAVWVNAQCDRNLQRRDQPYCSDRGNGQQKP